MKKLTLSLISSLIITAAFAGNSGVKKGTLLRLNLEKGSSHSIVTDMVISYFSDATMQDEMGKMENTMIFDYKVIDKSADGIHTIEASITKIKAKQSMQGMEVYYDSDDPETAQGMGAMVAQQFAPVLNKPFTFKVNNLGKVVEKPESTGEGGMSPADLIDNLFVEMPEQEISVGDTWKKSKDSEGGLPLDISVNFKVDDITKKVITLSFSADKSDLMVEEDSPIGDMDLKMGGKVMFDRNSGLMLSNSVSQTLSGSDPQQGDFFMVTTIKQTSK